MGDVHALRAARGPRDPARLLEHRARPDGLWRERSAQLARGHRCLPAVVAARHLSDRGALEPGARCQDSRQMGARAAAVMKATAVSARAYPDEMESARATSSVCSLP